MTDREAAGGSVGPESPFPGSFDLPERVLPGSTPSSRAPEQWTRVGRGPRRRTRWDRPPHPKDWRFFIGWLGRALIVLGLLMFLFVAYQLWGTGIETARAQNELEDKWNEIRAELDEPDPSAPATTPLVPVGTTLPVQTLPPVTVPGSTTPSGAPVTLPPVTVPPESTTTVAPATPVNLPPPERKEPMAYIAIPSIEVGYFVVPGVSRNDLKAGPGHFPDTPIPGTLGNSAIAGHRTTHKAPFSRLDELVVGDDIEIELANGTAFVYVVTGTEVVTPQDYHVISNNDPSTATLTLVTCTPKATSSHRLIVYAEIDPSRSSPIGESTYYVLDDQPSVPASAALPGDDDPTLVAPATTPAPVATAGAPATTTATAATAPQPSGVPDAGTAAPSLATTSPAAAEPVETTAASVTPVTDPPPAEDADADDGFVAAPVDQGTDAFSEGWFAEQAAWPQIGLWGLALALIVTAGWWLARFWKREWVGFAAGLVPFVVCLYFFFQNVNRLLPAGL